MNLQYNNNQNNPQPSSNFKYDTPIEPPKKSFRMNPKFKENLSTIIILISAPLLAILLSVFVFRTYQVDGPSMQNTLHDKDRLIINKLPKTVSRITGNNYIPDRYDIIVFEHTGRFSGSNMTEKQIIKRVIALPGERIVIKDGGVTVYNKENPNGFRPDKLGPQSNTVSITDGNIDETVKNGEIFVMGDNRGNSLDSRAIGTIRSQDIIGELVLRIYPFDNWKSF